MGGSWNPYNKNWNMGWKQILTHTSQYGMISL